MKMDTNIIAYKYDIG